MARKSSPTILQEELYPPPGEPERELDNARLVDLDVEEESPFLRGQKRVSARRGTLPKKTLHLLAWSAIALARLGSRIWLIDAGGTLMELPGAGKQKYSFPVIVGMNPGEPLSTRTARMRIYNQLVRELDSDGAHYSQDLSEVDISDQDDVKVLTNDSAGAVLVHLGSSDFLSRYKIYVTHVRGWRQQFEKLESVDPRYEHQISLNPDMQGTA